jgi:hypothetical protein
MTINTAETHYPLLPESNLPLGPPETNLHAAALGNGVSLKDVIGLTKQDSQDVNHVFGAGSIDRNGDLHFGDKEFTADSFPHPTPMPESDLRVFENLLRRDPNAKIQHLPDGGTRYSNSEGAAFEEHPDGRKVYFNNASQKETYETRPDGSWKQTTVDQDGKTTITDMKGDGSGTETVDKDPQKLNEKTITTWGAGGKFQQYLDYDIHSHKGHLTKPGPDGGLTTIDIKV